MDIKPSEKRFALIIDADNVSAKYIKPITDELSKYGTITYKRIYGDWTSTLHAKWKDALLENSITPIQQFSYTTGKNATDSAMIIDAMDIMYTNSVEGFCIVSSDSDFTRLASRIRESGLTVIGMGEKKTPTPFRKACDIFTTLELLVGDNGKPSGRRGHRGQSSAGAGQGSGPAVEQVERAVVDIVTDNQNNGKATGLGEVGSRLLKRYPDFDVRSYGTNQLTKLLDEFASVQVIKDGSSVAVELTEVSPSGPDSQPASDSIEEPAADSEQSENEAPESEKAESEGKPRRPRRGRSRRGRAKAQPVEVQEEKADGNPDASEQAQGVSKVIKPELRSEPGAENKQDPESDLASEADRGAGADLTAELEITPEIAQSAEVGQAAEIEQALESGQASAADPVFAAGHAPATNAAFEPDQPSGPSKALKRSSAPKSKQARKKSRVPKNEETPETLILDAVRSSGAEGVNVAQLSKQVRATFKNFKVRDCGFAQMRQYVASLGDIQVEKRGNAYFATLGE